MSIILEVLPALAEGEKARYVALVAPIRTRRPEAREQRPLHVTTRWKERARDPFKSRGNIITQNEALIHLCHFRRGAAVENEQGRKEMEVAFQLSLYFPSRPLSRFGATEEQF